MLVCGLVLWSFLPAFLNSVSVARRPGEVHQAVIRLNGYAPAEVDEYVATSVVSPKGFIVGFEPLTEASRVHHVLLYGCLSSFKVNEVWKGGSTCTSAGHILYAWAKNAPSLFLPPEVAFSVGHDTDPVKYLVLQVHYAFPFNGKILDYSGVRIHYVEAKPRYLAAVYLFVADKVGIPPRLPEFHVNMSCIYRETPIYPFAFRTHTHGMGRVVSAAIKNETGWTVVGKSNPQWPQLFNPINFSITIKKGDIMAARCIFDSSGQNRVVQMGYSIPLYYDGLLRNMGSDEMCNFYMMFYWDAEMEDPFPYGGVCLRREDAEIVNKEYPSAALSLLPFRPDLEHKGHQAGKAFGIIEVGAWETIQDHKVGQVSGLSFDVAGNLVVFHRAERKWSQDSFDEAKVFVNKDPIKRSTVWILKMDKSAKNPHLLHQFGENQFYLPHGIFVNDRNEYFTTDVGAHIVTKWKVTPNGLEEIFSLGTKFNPGRGREHFCMPTSVVTSPADGSIYIADGYCNSRIVKYAANGKYVSEWGEPYSTTSGRFPIGKDTLGMFLLPHDVSLNKDGSRLYVSDRQNARVQIFDPTGLAVGQITNLPDQILFNTTYSSHYSDGYVYFIPGDPDEKIRLFCAKAETASLLYSFEPSGTPLHMSHVIRVSPTGHSIYVGELSGSASGRVLQFEIQGQVMSMLHDGEGATEGYLMSTNGGSSHKWMFVALFILIFGIGSGLFYVRRKSLYRAGRDHSVLDRAGFKPLRMDYPSSEEDESDDDDTIISRKRMDSRF